MAAEVRLNLNAGAIRQIAHDPEVLRALLEDGHRMAREAAGLAPKRSGAAARSIAAEFDPEHPGEVIVSWDARYYYLIFHEDGWRTHPGQHFLRRTYESYRHL